VSLKRTGIAGRGLAAGAAAMSERTTGQRLSIRNFYGPSMSEAEQEALEAAHEVEGLTDEIAMLRVKLMTAIDEHPENLKLLEAGINMLVRAVAAQYRLSPKAKGELADSITAVLNNLGDQLLPPA